LDFIKKSYSRSTKIKSSTVDVFEWHTQPGAFERLTPPWIQTRGLEVHGMPPEPGSQVNFQTKFGPVWQRWLAEHGPWIPGEMFSDTQKNGPFKMWEHTHRFFLDEAGTRLKDTVDYKLPFGILGMLGTPFARREIDRMFSYRHRVTAGDIGFHKQYGGNTMNVLMTGSSGLIGSALTAFLASGGHQVRRLLREPSSEKNTFSWDSARGTFTPGALEGIDAVVHLAGENIAGGRWNSARKDRVRNSRVDDTRQLCEALVSLESPPKVLVAASATGFYGNRGNQLLDESTAPGQDFLSEVCIEWERATAPAREKGIRVVHLRIGIVLSPQGGALKQMLLPFKAGVGGVLGSGDQYMSWIALDDLLGVVLCALTNESVKGAVNAVAPHPVTNKEFTKTLGKVLRRPTIFPVPAIVLRLAMGEMADALLLSSTRVVPTVLKSKNFQFTYPKLESALRHLLGR